MSTAHVLFAAYGLDARTADHRLRVLGRFYDADPYFELHGRFLRGWLRLPALGGASDSSDELWWWGERPPASLPQERDLVRASDRELRVLDGAHAAVAVTPERARVLEGAGAPNTVAVARSGCAEIAWATQAVAAGILAYGRVALSESAIRDVAATHAPLGQTTLIEGVEALPPATVVDIDLRSGASPCERSYWPAHERWEPPEDPAESVLANTLRSRLDDEPSAWLALTAGRDSTALAAVATRAKLEFGTFTWGEPDWPDIRGAAQTAEFFGLTHVALPYLPLSDAEAKHFSQSIVRYADGVAPVGAWARPQVPSGLTAMVTGGGGEVGRAYYYTAFVRSTRRPRPRDLARVLLPDGADDVLRRLTSCLERIADETSLEGWDLLDVFYTEHRMGRWGRSRVSPLHGSFLAPYTSPQVAAALVALPLEERLRTAWHRRMVDPKIPMPAATVQRRGVPRWARRAAAMVRSTRTPSGGAWPWGDVIFGTRPDLRRWIADDLLQRPILSEALSRETVQELRDGFIANRSPLSEQAMLVAGAAALDEAITELRV